MKNIIVFFAAALTVLLCSAASCNDESKTSAKTPSVSATLSKDPANKPQHASDKEISMEFSDSYAAFGGEIFKKLYQPGNNVVISPLSMRMALDMLYPGAAGTTAKEIAEALRYPSDSGVEFIMENSKILLDSSKQRDDVTLEIANSLWAKENFKINKSYVKLAEKYFDAEIRNKISANSINDWVSKKTHKKIEKIIEGNTGDIQTLLLNAVYFNGNWAVAFNKQATAKQDFFVDDKTTIQVDMMNGKMNVPYFENEFCQMAVLSYNGHKSAMYIVLPKQQQPAQDILKSLSYKSFIDAAKQARNEEVIISIPKFKSEYESELNNALTAMGMRSAFDERANFNNISSGLFISNVIHKTYIDVNEKGTEAAAATGIVMTKSSIPAPPKVFKANRPFFFVIMDNKNNIPLFVGSIARPEYIK